MKSQTIEKLVSKIPPRAIIYAAIGTIGTLEFYVGHNPAPFLAYFGIIGIIEGSTQSLNYAKRKGWYKPVSMEDSCYYKDCFDPPV
jgi:hypothetical protein